MFFRDEPFDLELLSADAVRFVPVELRANERAVIEPNQGDAFSLSPPSARMFVVVVGVLGSDDRTLSFPLR
jgi:hypothetical protein